MDIYLDIAQNLQTQFLDQFEIKQEETKTEYPINPKIGSGGSMVYRPFPGGLEFYHFGPTKFHTEIHIHTINHKTTDWYCLHMNLAKVKQTKYAGDRHIDLQKYLPIGVLFYGPGLEIHTTIPRQVDSELATVRFSKSFLDTYFPTIVIDQDMAYVDLDARLESILNEALHSINDLSQCHGLVLTFVRGFFEKWQLRDQLTNTERIHPDDLKGLFTVASKLRQPFENRDYTLKVLAREANMGVTKFKTSFKQVFGKAPIEYASMIRMEYARQQLRSGRSPTEISNLLGYAHPSSFTLTYKKYYGELPSDTSKGLN